MSAYDNVGIFWDYENCAPSSNGSGYHLIDRIRQLSHQFGSVNLFKAYLQFPEKSSPKLYTLRSELQSCGVSLTDCPHNGKNSVDLMMIVDIMAFIKDNPAPATIILISGDRDFAYLLATIRWRQYHVVLISNTFMTHDSLSSQAHLTFDWQADVLKTRNDGDPLRSSSFPASRETSISTQVSPESAESTRPTLGNKTSLQSLPGFRRSSDAAPSAALNTTDRDPESSVSVGVPLPEDLLASVDISKLPVHEENSTASSTMSFMSSQTEDWVLTNHSPTEEKQVLAINEVATLSPVFLSAQSSPELVSSEVEGDIPSSPGYLLLLGESDDSAEFTPVENLKIRDDLAKETCIQEDMQLVKESCDCKICLRSGSATESVRSDPIQELTPTNAPAKSMSPKVDSEPALPITTSSPKTTEPSTICSSLNIMAPTFAPRYTQVELSEAPVTPQPTFTPKPEFKDLISVLNDMRLKGIAKPRFSNVAPLLLARKPNIYQSAGVSQFKAYIQLAENMGIVSIEDDKDGDGWMCLRRPWHEGGSLPSSPPRSHIQQTSPKPDIPRSPPPQTIFQDLVVVLNELRMNDELEPRFSIVIARLLKRKANAYELAGTTRFKDYIDAAVKAGIVTVRGVQNGDGWITLCNKWISQPEQIPPPHSTPPPSAHTPIQMNTSSSSKFQPLISILEDLRTRGYTRPRVPKVFAKLFWSGQPKIQELAGVSTFKDYLNAALSAGVINIEGGDASNPNAAVYLRDSEGYSNGVKVTAPSTSDATTAHAPHSAAVFEDLTHVLEELRWMNMTEVLYSEVSPLILARNPQVFEEAGVSTIREYVLLAARAGVVIVTEHHGVSNGWVKLCKEPTSSRQPPSTQSLSTTNAGGRPFEATAQASTLFRDLVLVLQQLRSSGENEARFTSVVPLLLKRKPNAYQSVGVTKFKDYIGLAVTAGIVSVKGMKNGDGWVTLCDSRPGNARQNYSPPPLSAKTSHSSDQTATPSPAIPPMYRELVNCGAQERKNRSIP